MKFDQDWVDEIHRFVFQTSTFLKLMNHDTTPRQTASEIGGRFAGHACNPDTKPSPARPAAWLHVETAKNGWSVFVNDRPAFGRNVQPDFVFNDVVDCAQKIVTLLCPDKGEAELRGDEIRKLSDALLRWQGEVWTLKERVESLNNEIVLVAAGRDQDRAEHLETVQTYQARVDTLVKQLHDAGDCREKAEADRDHWQRTGQGLAKDSVALRAEIHTLRTQLAEAQEDAEQWEETAEGWRKDNATATASIRVLNAEIAALNQRLQNSLSIIGRETHACVDGKVYPIDDLCKAHSELTAEFQKLESELCGVRVDQSVKRSVIESLQNRVEELESISGVYARRLDNFPAARAAEWKRGFDSGRDHTMDLVSRFCKQTCERLAQKDQNAS